MVAARKTMALPSAVSAATSNGRLRVLNESVTDG